VSNERRLRIAVQTRQRGMYAHAVFSSSPVGAERRNARVETGANFGDTVDTEYNGAPGPGGLRFHQAESSENKDKCFRR
jgi:hypothetical protein